MIGRADNDAAMVRHYAGPIVDIFHHGHGSILRQMESGSGKQGNERWLQLTRWQIRSEGIEDGDRFENTLSTLSPLITPVIDNFGPLVFLAADPGDSTLALAGMFTTPDSMEGAWQAMRLPGQLRDTLERQFILTEFVAGAVIDLFALGHDTDVAEVEVTSILATK
jgi:hypothetical protein